MKAKWVISKIASMLLVLCLQIVGYSQTPQGFSYQAVVRDGSGIPIASQYVGLRITLEDASHVAYYTETQRPQTNAQGVFSVTIGAGDRVGNNLFSSITWEKGDVFIKLEIDPAGGTSYAAMGVPSKLQSVPYALYAENTKEVVSQPNAVDTDPIFVVKNKLNQTVFAVYQSGVSVYVANAQKGAKGGFAIGGLTSKGGVATDYFNVSPSSTPDIIANSAQMLWYPLKEAFLVGRVEVLDPADVGLNSFSSGSLSKAKGSYSQAIGSNSVASGNYSTAIGQSCVASGLYSFAFGSNSLANNQYNVAIGNGSKAIGSSNNYAFGNNATASGDNDNYAIGSNTKIVEGRDCYAIGSHAEIYPFIYNGSGSAGSYALGNYALVKGQRAYAIGDHARALNNDAIAIGTNTKSTAYLSIAIGANGSNADTTFATGQASVAMGYAAKSEGSSSIALGTRSVAGYNNAVAIGNDAQANGVNSTAIGNGAVANTSNMVRIGNGAVTTITGNVVLTAPSDARLKKNIKDLSSGLDFIMKLRPVEYQMNQGDDRTNFGFIAQDIEQLVGTNNSMLTIGADAQRTLGLRYTDFVAPLVKALQEQQNEIEELKLKNDELSQLKVQYDNLKNEFEQIKASLKK